MKRADDMGRGALLRIFGWPLLLAVLSAFGLVFALVGDGAWDAASWLLLTAPIAAIAWALMRPRANDGAFGRSCPSRNR